MFQSNKEYIDFLIQSGVHTFLKETPNNLLENQGIKRKIFEKKDVKKLEDIYEINELIINIKSSKYIKKDRKKTSSL